MNLGLPAILQLVLIVNIFSVLGSNLFTGNRLWDAARNQGARCLDGSEPHYFFRAGLDDTKWFIFYEGGGWCTPSSIYYDKNAFDSCSYRSSGYLGSTRMDTPTLDLNTDYFSTDPARNPVLATFNMVYIRYCDGSSFTSNLDGTFTQDRQKLYFRGARIRKAVADDLFANKNLGAAVEVVIGGCSAGGLAANIAVDWWSSQFQSSTRVTALLDSSFFVETNQNGCDYLNGLKDLSAKMNTTHALNAACLAAKPTEQWKCMFAQEMDPYVKTPMFALQPKFDDWQLWAESCVPESDTAAVDKYGKLTLDLFKNQFIGSTSNRGGFVDSCRHHCWKYDELHVNGLSNAFAFRDWYEKAGSGGTNYWIDDQGYKCDSCCSAA